MKNTAEYILTGGQFEEIDCSEAVLNVNYPALTSSIVRLGLWGIVFHLRDHPLPEVPQVLASAQSSDMAYLPDWSSITFTEVHEVEVRVAPYLPSFDRDGVLDREAGEPTELHKLWKSADQRAPLHTYGFDCVLDQPYGYCSLFIRACGTAKLTYRPDLLIPFSEYQADPKSFGWWEVGRLRV